MTNEKIQSVNKLRKEEHNLIRLFDKGVIDVHEYDEKVGQVREKINELNKAYMKEKREEDLRKYNEVKKMAEEKKAKATKVKQEKKEEPKKIGTKPKADSMASLIANELVKKGVKNADKVADNIIQKTPDADRKKIISKTKVIINECKKGKGRWKNYTWDDENYLLTPKE